MSTSPARYGVPMVGGSEAVRVLDVKAQAVVLLNQLLRARDSSEARHAEEGTVDPMRSIRGHSAFDEAIVSTRQMIGRIDRMIELKPLPGTDTDDGVDRDR